MTEDNHHMRDVSALNAQAELAALLECVAHGGTVLRQYASGEMHGLQEAAGARRILTIAELITATEHVALALQWQNADTLAFASECLSRSLDLLDHDPDPAVRDALRDAEHAGLSLGVLREINTRLMCLAETANAFDRLVARAHVDLLIDLDRQSHVLEVLRSVVIAAAAPIAKTLQILDLLEPGLDPVQVRSALPCLDGVAATALSHLLTAMELRSLVQALLSSSSRLSAPAPRQQVA